VTFTYTSGGCDGNEFEVNRCAADTASLQTYLEALGLNEAMTPNMCKKMWLEGCSSFFQSYDNPVVVVAKQIDCNKQVCDQTPFFSNCESNADCAAIASVADGPPYAGYAWPWGQSNVTTLPAYRPCCSFWESYCNGASCSGRQAGTGASCPLTEAGDNGFCVDDGDCWYAGSATALSVPMGLTAIVALAASLLSMRH